MNKVAFIGAGSTSFAKNVLGDSMLTPALCEFEIALYDIDSQRLEESYLLLNAINKECNASRATIKKYIGTKQRKEALRDARFVINAIQIGGYEPSTVIDFEIPKKYGLRQTIADTMGIGGIFRGLRTIVVLKDIAEDMEEVCPDAWFLNYTNPMGILSGYMQRYTKVKTVGLCHSVQVCSEGLLRFLDIEYEGVNDLIAGINHMGWLLKIEDKYGNDLYPEIKKRAALKNATEKHGDMVRFDYIKNLGYYCTESSEHNSEYNPFYIKSRYPELIEKFCIPLDDYPRRCVSQIDMWEKQKKELLNGGSVGHKRSREYAASIMEAIVTNKPFKIGGNVINNGAITNLPANACVEVPCLVDTNGIQPTYIGDLPLQLAAMNMTNINVQLLTIEAAVTKKKEHIYHAAMMDPHTSAELSIDDIVAMSDEMFEAHEKSGFRIL